MERSISIYKKVKIMAQYSNNASGLNISIDNKTVSSTVDGF